MAALVLFRSSDAPPIWQISSYAFAHAIHLGSSTVKILFASSDRLLPGQDASLLCSVIGSITFQITRWEKGGTALNLNDSRYTSNPKLTSLGIHKVTKTDTGLYRCVATIDGAEKSGAKYLAVLGKRFLLVCDKKNL